ncbi:MAG: hypothetical protein ACLPVF_11565 [Acidimicrobiales bacterium]
MSYVIAGYVAALGSVFLYGISLLLRRRRWERALKVAQASELPEAPATDGTTAPVVPGGRP